MNSFDEKSREFPASSMKRMSRVNMTLNVSVEMITLIDELKVQYGVRTRSRVVEMILEDLLLGDQSADQGDD